VLTISSGHSADYLLNAVATGRENYYTGAVAEGEPPGRWYGAGAEALGLRGLVDAQDMQALYEHFLDPRDPNFRDADKWNEVPTLGHAGRKYPTADEIFERSLNAEPYADAERREQLRLNASKQERKNISFMDVTFSVQKSITVLHAAFEAEEVKARAVGDLDAAEAWGAHRQAVEDTIWAGNCAGLDYLSEHAGYSRAGHHGGAAGRFVDAHDWTVASFLQHTSRNNDPQLHIHNAVLWRVLGADGVWRTLDSRSLHLHRGAAGAVAERTTEEHLMRALGIRVVARPDGKSREILGIASTVLDLFSSRRRAITRHTAELVDAFEAKFGRSPNALELDRLKRQATFATRRAKSHDGESIEQRLERFDRELRAEVSTGLAQVAADVLSLAGRAPEPERWSPRAVIETALAEVQATKAAWTAPDLTRAISKALPDRLGDLDGGQVAQLLDDLTAEGLKLAVRLDRDRPGASGLPDALRLANGGSVYERPGARSYATPDHIHSERLLAASTAERGAPVVESAAAQRFIAGLAETGIELGADQAAAVRGVLTSGAEVESLVGPAGTGKSFVVGVLAQAWQDSALWDGQRRKVVGLASSQIATEVLTSEGLTARNIARWLGTHQRLAVGAPFGDDLDWRLSRGDLVVVDESAIADTAQLAAIHRITREAGAKLLLTGDHRQLAAVGAAGGMELAADTGLAYELAEARRFIHPWERAASLRLRDGDESVLGEYHKQGRIIDGGAIEQTRDAAARAWLADSLAGRRSLLLVDTNEQAALISAQLRAELIHLGRVEEHGVPLGLQDTMAGVGDLVQARRNGWQLAGVLGNRRGPINREQYRVLETRDDGGLVVAPILGRTGAGEQLGERMTLPGDYVVEHVALGYASTVHAAQGLTVDTTHSIVTARTGPAALYVGMSRGREANTAYVVTRAVPDDAPTGTANQVQHREAKAVLASAFETAEPEKSALATAVEAEQDAQSIKTQAELFADAAELATAGRTARLLDQLAADGHLTAEQRVALAAEDGGATLTRLLRRAELAGHDPRRVLTDAVTSRPLHDARQLSNVLHHRIREAVSLDPAGERYADWIPAVDDAAWQPYLTKLAHDADQRRDELGHQVAEQKPQWAIEAFGHVPEDEAERHAWRERAGAVAAHRELTGHEDEATPLGAAPKAGQVEAYPSWRSAWRALGRPEADRDEAEMSDGQLHMRVRAYEREQAWAPRYVADELAGTRQAAERHRATASLRAAEAHCAADKARRAQLEQEVADAAALADVLDARVEELTAVDEARGIWWLHTAGTRAAADRAAAELHARRAADGRRDERITADEWADARARSDSEESAHRERQRDDALDASRTSEAAAERASEQRSAHERETSDASMRVVETDTTTAGRKDDSRDERHHLADDERTSTYEASANAEDQHREITDESELADVEAQREADRRAVDNAAHADAAETHVPDIRETADRELERGGDDQVRVPTSSETADSIRRAQRALAEIRVRDAADRQRARDEARTEQLARWHDEKRDVARGRAAVRDDGHGQEPVLSRGGM
jgi:conjugative relaxase-like TrwC/TraI family protein